MYSTRLGQRSAFLPAQGLSASRWPAMIGNAGRRVTDAICVLLQLRYRVCFRCLVRGDRR